MTQRASAIGQWPFFVIALMWVWIGALCAVAVVVGRRFEPRGRTLLALALAVLGLLSFVFWPFQLEYWSRGSASFDAATGQTTQTSAEGLRLVLFPIIGSVREQGLRILLFAAIPAGITTAACIWQELCLPWRNVVRLIALAALVMYFPIGTVSALSWWSIPAMVALTMAVATPERATPSVTAMPR